MRKPQLLDTVDIVAALGDLKEDNYRLWLVVSALVETLEAENVIASKDLEAAARRLEAQDAAAVKETGTT